MAIVRSLAPSSELFVLYAIPNTVKTIHARSSDLYQCSFLKRGISTSLGEHVALYKLNSTLYRCPRHLTTELNLNQSANEPMPTAIDKRFKFEPISGRINPAYKLMPAVPPHVIESRRDQEEGGELDSHEEVRHF